MPGPLEKTPDMEGMSPADRAAEYKRRAAAAGIGRAPNPGAAPAAAPSAEAAAPAPSPAPAAAAPAAPAPAAEKPAAPPAKPAPPPEPEKPKDPVFVTRLLETIPDASWHWRHGYAEMKVPRESLLQAARLLRDEGFDYLSFVTEVDWQDRLEMVYHLFSYDYERQPLGAILRADLPRDGGDRLPEIASLTAVWPGAEFMEREAYEMMGIRFLGHPDLRKILLPDDFVGFPMRKDYQTDFEYVTVKQLVRELRPE
jgi:NADH-quinone oxidoreductase subunit C